MRAGEEEEEEEKSRAGARRSRLTLERAAIEGCIPHREPFLFLDRVEIETEDAASATWHVPPEADFFRGHFPGNPVTPGVILCEHTFQAGAVLLVGRDPSAERGLMLLARIEKAKFKRMVRPGETLETRVRLVDAVGPASYLDCEASVGGELALELRCVLTKGRGSKA